MNEMVERNADFNDLRKLPEEVYSNFDHTFTPGVLEQLEKGGCRAYHAAWNFIGWVYKDGGRWKNAIMVYGSHRTTFDGDTAKDVIEQACDQFGRE